MKINKNSIMKQNFAEDDVDPMGEFDNPTTYTEIQSLKNQGTKAKVGTANELLAALKNSNIHYIQLTNNILMSNTAIPGYQDGGSMQGLTSGQIPPHDFIIDGNNNKYTLEGRTGTDYPEIYLNNTYHGKIILNNINLCGTDYYGPVTTRDQNDPAAYSKTQLIYRNINYTGSQLTASYYAKTIFTGNNTVDTSKRYYIGLDPNNNYSRTYTVGYQNSVNGKNPNMIYNFPFQENIEASSVVFDKNTNYVGSSGGPFFDSNGNSVSSNSGCFALGKWYSYDGRADIMNNAHVTLQTKGDYYEWSNKATLIVNGTLEVHPNAVLTVNTDNIKPPAGYSQNVYNHYNGIVLDNAYNIQSNLIIDSGATLNDNMQGPTDSIKNNNNPGDANGGTLSIGPNAKISVGAYGDLNISSTKNTYSTAPLIDGSPNSTFNVSQYGQFSLKYKSDGTVSNFGKDANGLMFMGDNSSFNFTRASSVNLEDDTSSYTAKKLPLLYSPSADLKVNTQNVYTWNNGNLNWGTSSSPYENIKNANNEYPSMFNMISKYNSNGNISSTGNSTYEGIAATFKNNFNTDKLQRVQYNYIPSVHLTSVKQMTDDINSLTLSGKVLTQDGYDSSKNNLPLADALIRIKGHVSNTNSNAYWNIDNQYTSAKVDLNQPIPDGTIVSPVNGDTIQDGNDYRSNFNAKTDSNGNFSITIPKSLMASDPSDTTNSNPTKNGRIQIFAFKDGNFDNENYAVNDVTPPKAEAYSKADARVVQANHPITDPKSFIKNYSDFSSNTNSNIWNKSVSFSFDNSKNPSDLWTSPGLDKEVYIKATDDAGNITELKSYLDVYANNSYIICNKTPVTMDLPKDSEKPSDWNSWTISENNVKAYTINNDGSGNKTDISNLIISDASNSMYTGGSHTITYTLPSQYNAAPVKGIIIFKINLGIAVEEKGPLTFGPTQAMAQNDYIKPKNSSYNVLVTGVNKDNKNNIKLTGQAEEFELNGSQISSSCLNLGLVEDEKFNSLLTGEIPLSNPDSISNGSYDYDLINGKNKIILQNRGLSYPGTYKTKITWTLSDTIGN